MKTAIKSVLILTVICMISAAILGAVNSITVDRIRENSRIAEKNARTEVLPAGEYTYETLTLTDIDCGTVTAAWKAVGENGTFYVFRMETKGYASGLVLTCGIDAAGKLVGTKTVTSGETPSLGGKTERSGYTGQYLGKTAAELDSVDGISGATKTSNAYRNAISDAFRVFSTLTGGDAS